MKTDFGQDSPRPRGGIVRVSKPDYYSIISNEVLRDSWLSFGARGVLAYLFSRPSGWEMRVDDLIEQSPAGRDAIYAMLKELEKYGYLKRTRRQVGGGKFVWENQVFESPSDAEPEEETASQRRREKDPFRAKPEMVEELIDKPFPAFPDTVEPEMVAPFPEKPEVEELYREELSKEERTKEERTNRQESNDFPPPPHSVVEGLSSRLLPPASYLSPLTEALCQVCGLVLDCLNPRDLEALLRLVPWIEAQSYSPEAAAREVLARFAWWDKPTPPHLSQIRVNWARMKQIECLKQNREMNNHESVPQTANGRRLQAIYGQRLGGAAAGHAANGKGGCASEGAAAIASNQAGSALRRLGARGTG